MIAVGEHYRGPEQRNSRISSALDRTGVAIRNARPGNISDGAHPWVNPVFVVGGSLGEPNFNDIRLGHYDKKEKGLVVEIAIPRSVADSKNLRDPIVRGLQMANAAAFHFFDDKGMEFPLRDAEALVTRVSEELVEFA